MITRKNSPLAGAVTQGWTAAGVFIDVGLRIKAVMLPFTPRQAFTQFPLSGGAFVLGRIHSDYSQLVILQKDAEAESALGFFFGIPNVFLSHFHPDIDGSILINHRNAKNFKH